MKPSLVLILAFLTAGSTAWAQEWAGDGNSFPTEPSLQAVSQETRYADDVVRRLEAVESQLKSLHSSPTATSAQGDIQQTAAWCTECGQATAHCGCSSGLFGAIDGNGFPTASLTGFFQLDAGYYSQDATNRETLGDIENSLAFRRARLAAKGQVAEDISYIMEFDFAQDQPRFVDVWMQFDQTPLGNIRIGRFRQPFGMAELTSVRELPFLERPLMFALAPFRQTGIMFSGTAHDQAMTWAASGYRYLSDNFGNVYADGGFGLASRFTVLPVDNGDGDLVHVGLDYSYNNPGRDQVVYVSTNEFFGFQNPALGLASLSVLPIVGVPPFVLTGAMPTDRTNLFNLEAAVARGSLIAQSEIRWAVVDQLNGVSNTFPGAYLHVRYLLTGEVVPYSRTNGVFGRVKPDRPLQPACDQWGAWEIGARLSYLDLNGDALPGPGRRLTDVTVGLSWYLNDHVRFQWNWIHAALDDPRLGSSSADTLAMRGQIDF